MDIFDRLSNNQQSSVEDIFDRLSTKKNLFGNEGSLIGGKFGRAVETAINTPQQIFAELPVAAAKVIESPVSGANAISQIVSSLLGQPSPPEERETFLSHLTPPEKTKMASEILGDYFRKNLPEELKEGANDISDIEALLIPFLKNVKLPKFIENGPGFSNPPSSSSGPGISIGKNSFKKTTSELKDIGNKVKEKIFGPNISKDIPESISQQKFRNTTKGGMELEKAVSDINKKLNLQEKKAYLKSRKLNKNIQAIHPELEKSLSQSLQELEKIPDPSAPLKRFIESTKKVLNEISVRSDNGTVIGYKPISNQVLIDQIQEYNQIPKFDFPTDSKTGIFKTLIKDLTKAVDATAVKNPAANKAWKEAKRMFSEKSKLFEDSDVFKWTKLAEKSYSKEFISSIDIDKIRKLKPVLEKTSRGRDVLQKMKRGLVEKVFEDYFGVGKRFNNAEISSALAELEPVLTSQEIKIVEKLFKEAQTPGAKAAALSYKIYRYFRRPTSSAVKDISSMK